MDETTWSAVDTYFEQHLLAPDAALEAVLHAALAASNAGGLPQIQVSASQGKLLHLLALAQAPARILEIGTLGGYSAIWLAHALAPGGRLTTLELDPLHATVARANFALAGIAGRVDLLVGPALESLAQLRRAGVAPFDFVFIDADKPNIPAYTQAALELSRPGTVIVVDNVVRRGEVIAAQPDAAATGVRRLVEWLATEPRLAATAIQTVGSKGYDGFLMARVNAPR